MPATQAVNETETDQTFMGFGRMSDDERIEMEENLEQLADAAVLLVDTADYTKLTADDVLLYCLDCTKLLIGHRTRGDRPRGSVPEEVWGWRRDPRYPHGHADREERHLRPICKACAKYRAGGHVTTGGDR